MHINAQTKVDQMTMWLKKQRGHDQHAAITTTITTSITTSSPRSDLGVCGSGRKLEMLVKTDVRAASAVTAVRAATAASRSPTTR